MSRPTTTFARSAIFSALTLPLLLAGQTGAQSYTQQLQKSIGIDQKLGDQIPLDLEFTDSNGKRTALRQYFGQEAHRTHLGVLRVPHALHPSAE